MPDLEVYETVCKPRFDQIESKVGDIHKVICGNGTEGIADKVRKHESYFTRVFWAMGVCFVAVVGAIVKVIFYAK